MQYYTKQQLQGAGGYSPGVRVGNWNEEANMQETKLKELLLKQQEGSLKLNLYARHKRLGIGLASTSASTDLTKFTISADFSNAWPLPCSRSTARQSGATVWYTLETFCSWPMWEQQPS